MIFHKLYKTKILIFTLIILFVANCIDDNVLSSYPGCTDILACNYDSNATVDNDTCLYTQDDFCDCNGNIYDCAGLCGGDSLLDDCGVCNGDGPSFICDDEAIVCNEDECGQILGCMDESACNYNPLATYNVSCEYALENFNCQGDCLSEYDCNDECGGSALLDICGICDGTKENIEECIVVNEILASNDYWCEDGTDSCSDCQYCGEDYAEFLNISDQDIDISGWVFGDSVGDVGITAPEGTIIQSGEFLLIWFIGDDDLPWPQASDKLSSSGETIWVAAEEDGTTIIELDFGQQTTDISQSRCPDGVGFFIADTPSPGLPNCNINE